MPSALQKELEAIIAEKHLLNHPFYQAWEKGTLPIEVMRKYAEQYYHLEKNFPIFLSKMHAQAGDNFEARQHITENLHDEEFGPNNHRELWLTYSEAIGAARADVESAPAIEETQAAVETFKSLSDSSMIEGVAALAAYESQMPAVAGTKIKGLKEHYGVTSEDGLKFFQVHGIMDIEHSDAWWEILDATEMTEEIREKIKNAVTEGRDALWNFLSGIVRVHMPELAYEC